MKTTVELATNDSIEKYCFISDTFVKVVERFASLKKKIVTGYQAPFMNKKLKKALFNKSRFRNNSFQKPYQTK